MKTFTYRITDPVGIHARPAGMIVKEVKNYSSQVMLIKDEKKIDAGKLMLLMGLGVKNNDEVCVEITGEDEEQAYLALKTLFETNL